MTGQPRTRHQALQDWTALLFGLTVTAGVVGALCASVRVLGVAVVFAAATGTLAATAWAEGWRRQ